MIEFLLTIGNLKQTKRQGWVNHSIKEAESISDHMHRMGIIAMSITDASIKKDKLIKMAIVHDLAEAIIGDLTPDDNVSKERKFELEYNGIKTFIKQLNGSSFSKEIEDLWLEYEQGITPEAMLCKDIDKYEMILQAYEYEKAGHGPLQSFFDSTRGKFTHPEVIHLVEELYQCRNNNRM